MSNVTLVQINGLPPFVYGETYVADLTVGTIILVLIEYLLLRKTSLQMLKYAIPTLTGAFFFLIGSFFIAQYATYSPIMNGSTEEYIVTPYSTLGSALIYLSIAVVIVAFAFVIIAIAHDVFGRLGGEHDFFLS